MDRQIDTDMFLIDSVLWRTLVNTGSEDSSGGNHMCKML